MFDFPKISMFFLGINPISHSCRFVEIFDLFVCFFVFANFLFCYFVSLLVLNIGQYKTVHSNSKGERVQNCRKLKCTDLWKWCQIPRELSEAQSICDKNYSLATYCNDENKYFEENKLGRAEIIYSGEK